MFCIKFKVARVINCFHTAESYFTREKQRYSRIDFKVDTLHSLDTIDSRVPHHDLIQRNQYRDNNHAFFFIYRIIMRYLYLLIYQKSS